MRAPQSGRLAAVLILVLAAASIAGFLFLGALRAGPPPAIEISPGLPAIGKKTPVRVTVREPGRGLGIVRVELIQGGRAVPLAERSHSPAPSWALWSSGVAAETIDLEVGKEKVPGLVGGEATIRVTANRAGSWLRSPDPAVLERTLPVRLSPPSLQVLSTATYLSQGGAEAVVYRVGESAVVHGVRCGDWLFPGFPLPGGGPLDRFAFFGAPWDLSDPTRIRLVASDDVGNEAAVAFVDRFFPKPIRSETLRLSDSFLQKVVPEILGQTPDLADRGDLLENYLMVNGELRRKNAAALVELARSSRPSFLWSRRFVAMPNTKVMSSFADRRDYEYQGRVVDHQVHLGFDLASVRGAPVPAANDGVVVLARYFGIYGNSVILDHGYGLMTLYGHLSSIDVKDGQEVRRGDPIGRSGQTGLAGGDHLHFSVLLHGLPVDPAEWWDDHWLRDRIARKLGPAFALNAP